METARPTLLSLMREATMYRSSLARETGPSRHRRLMRSVMGLLLLQWGTSMETARPTLLSLIGGSNNVSVLLGKGDGTFQTQKTYAVGDGPNSVAVGDFNGDG